MSTATLTGPEVPAVAPEAVGVKVPAFGPTGPDVLAHAAHVMPLVAERLPYSGDVHAALFVALTRLRVGADRYHRLRLADEARDMLSAYLVAAGRAVPEVRASATIRGWVIGQNLAGAQRALVAAAGFWRRELDPLAGTPDNEGAG